MPVDIVIDGHDYSVATKEEILEFANKIRKAGGADPIPDLFPSTQHDPNSCLIANAVNFKSSVDECSLDVWVMTTHDPFLSEQIRDELGLEGEDTEIILPEEIGNAAYAFDCGVAFQEYVKEANAN